MPGGGLFPSRACEARGAFLPPPGLKNDIPDTIMITEHKELAEQIAEAQAAAARITKAGGNLELITNALATAARETQVRIEHFTSAPKTAPKPPGKPAA